MSLNTIDVYSRVWGYTFVRILFVDWYFFLNMLSLLFVAENYQWELGQFKRKKWIEIIRRERDRERQIINETEGSYWLMDVCIPMIRHSIFFLQIF